MLKFFVLFPSLFRSYVCDFTTHEPRKVTGYFSFALFVRLISCLFVLCCFDFLCSFLICLPSLCLCLNPHEPSKATEFFQLVFVIFQVGAFSPSLLHHEAPEELCAWMTHKIQNSGFYAGIIKMGTMGKMCLFVILDCDEEKRALLRVYLFLIFKEWKSGALFWDSSTRQNEAGTGGQCLEIVIHCISNIFGFRVRQNSVFLTNTLP